MGAFFQGTFYILLLGGISFLVLKAVETITNESPFDEGEKIKIKPMEFYNEDESEMVNANMRTRATYLR